MITQISLYESSVQETKKWVADVQQRMGLDDQQHALRGLTAVLHALRDELSVNQNAALAAQMPAMLRGIYFQDWKPLTFEPKHTTQRAFLNRIQTAFTSYASAPDAFELAEQVFAVLESRISGECTKIRRTLPSDLREMWPTLYRDADEQ